MSAELYSQDKKILIEVDNKPESLWILPVSLMYWWGEVLTGVGYYRKVLVDPHTHILGKGDDGTGTVLKNNMAADELGIIAVATSHNHPASNKRGFMGAEVVVPMPGEMAFDMAVKRMVKPIESVESRLPRWVSGGGKLSSKIKREIRKRTDFGGKNHMLIIGSDELGSEMKDVVDKRNNPWEFAQALSRLQNENKNKVLVCIPHVGEGSHSFNLVQIIILKRLMGVRVDAIEVLNRAKENINKMNWLIGAAIWFLGTAIWSVSDSHQPGSVGEGATLVLIRKNKSDVDGVLESMGKMGLTFPAKRVGNGYKLLGVKSIG